MISDRCDFDDFVSKTTGRDYHEIIYLADREATAAQRRVFHTGVSEEEKDRCGYQYAECLKGVIAYLRYGIKPACVSEEALVRLDRIREDALTGRPFGKPSDVVSDAQEGCL
jgi:hypothetical protein